MNAYTLLLNYLFELLQSDTDVNTITEGEQLDRIDISKKNIYPLAHIEANDGVFTDNDFQFNLSVDIVDQLDYNNEIKVDKFTSNDNRQDVYNTSLQSLRRLYNELKRNNNINVNPTGTANFQKIKEDKNDLVGFQLTMTISVPNDIMSLCE